MKHIKLEILLEVQHWEDLAIEERQLAEQALEAAGRAYAPYSGYNVGAAALLANGETVTGNNQENAAYPSGLCAERVALFYAGSRYPGIAVRTLAIVAMAGGEIQENISPCGACRQVLLETEQRYGSPMRVLLCGKEKVVAFSSAADLLPLCFGRENLEVGKTEV